MTTRIFISVITLAALATTSLHAGVIPGRWQKLDRQPQGKGIIVTLKTGERASFIPPPKGLPMLREASPTARDYWFSDPTGESGRSIAIRSDAVCKIGCRLSHFWLISR